MNTVEPNPSELIRATDLTKVYGNFAAVSDVSFTCRRGEIVGMLGPNGAGKTTTMRILAGYLPPTSGAASINGFDTLTESLQARQSLGYMPETVPLYPEMTVEGYLAYVGRLRRVDDLWDRVDDVLESVDLLDRAETFIGKLSKGMRQRVGLAQALIHDPAVLILDEPTIGLDPAQIKEVRDLIAALGQRHTILLSTHILTEVEQLCSRVIMIIDGRIRADMPIAEVMGGDGSAVLTLRLAQPTADSAAVLAQIPGVRSASPDGSDGFNLAYDGRDETRVAVGETAVGRGWRLLEMSAGRLSLESVFLQKVRQAALEDELPAEGDDEQEAPALEDQALEADHSLEEEG
ncbi:MAG: ABC transporter ATP-binding protein [Candidatus Promineifilaceae bacterium]